MSNKILSPIIEAIAMHPGIILQEEFLTPLKLSQYELAKSMGVGAIRISEIVKGKRSITAETAVLLSEYFKNSPSFWMNMQTHYDLAMELKKRRLIKETLSKSAAKKAKTSKK